MQIYTPKQIDINALRSINAVEGRITDHNPTITQGFEISHSPIDKNSRYIKLLNDLTIIINTPITDVLTNTNDHYQLIFVFPDLHINDLTEGNIVQLKDAWHYIDKVCPDRFMMSNNDLILAINIGPLTLNHFLGMTPDLLDQFLNIASSADKKIMKVNHKMLQLLCSLIQYEYTDSLQLIMGSVKTQELLVLQLSQILNSESEIKKTTFSKSDIEKIMQVNDIISEDINTTLSLTDLAVTAGLNVDKLKKGYKEVFGTTVFNHLREMKMQKAKELLEAKKHSITQISELVGYKNPQHFTAAFKKRFGILPSELIK